MLTKTRSKVQIPRREWEELRKNPVFADLIELLEDQHDLAAARKVTGKDVELNQYLKNRGIRSHS
ncbi:MAG: hypothetical protein HYY49_12690 [Ignavibacteriales bacterium]|nr:hypothetical protein [Ignavibacteriales bacterium]